MIDYRELQTLYKIYKEKNDEHSIKSLIKLTYPWLFNIVYQLLVDEDKAESVLKRTYERLILKNIKYEPDRYIIYEIFLIAKELTLRIK